MALDLRAGANLALANRTIDGIIPVGEAWNRAFAEGVADPNPYDGTDFGKVDLWTYDQYHASTAGYYLEALMVFGKVTGLDPRSLGANEKAADDLGPVAKIGGSAARYRLPAAGGREAPREESRQVGGVVEVPDRKGLVDRPRAGFGDPASQRRGYPLGEMLAE